MMRAFCITLCIFAPLSLAAATLDRNQPLAVRVLYDTSGSMYPGYAPPGSANRRTKSELGARYFHEYPQFRQWLADFIDAQAEIGAGTIGMWTFTSDGAFAPADVREVHPEVPAGRFDLDAAMQRFPNHGGQNTYLTESVHAITQDFSGLLWLITDNIVETRAGEPNADVERFFRTLNDQPRFRSVHLFKYPFADPRGGQQSALAVYGILVSRPEVPEAALTYFDGRFRDRLRPATRRNGQPLFPGHHYLKLKNLSIDPLVLHAEPTLKLILDDAENGMFREGQVVQLGLSGEIRSNLTQHSVTAGRYEISVASPFSPEDWARRDLGVKPLPAQGFETTSDEIRDPIPPNGKRQLSALLRSAEPVSFHPSNIGSWLRLAWNGAVVQYTGTIRLSFTDVNVRLERAQMAGIFGIDRASAIFNFQDVRTLERIPPSEAQVRFALKTDRNRTLQLLGILAVLIAAIGSGSFLLSRPQWFHIGITSTPDRIIALRRLGSHTIAHDGQVVGHLARDLLGGWSFRPNVTTAALQIRPGTQPDTWDVKLREGRAYQLSIVPRGGAKRRPIRKRPATAPPARPGPGTTANVRPMPKIDRP